MTFTPTARGRHRTPRGGRERAKGLVTVASALVIGLIASGATWSAFNAQTSTTGNQFNTGTVLINNNAGSAAFNLTGMRPGTPVSRCVRVVYTGTLTAAVKLYGATTATTGLDQYLNVSVTRGTGGTLNDCTAFVADATNYSGLGNGVLFSGLLNAYPNSLGTAIADPKAAWVENDAFVYRITVDVADDNNAEGKSATQTFTWDAR